MIIFIEAKTKAHERAIKKTGADTYKVSTPAVPERGRANEDIIDILAEFFDIPRSTISLRSGHSSKKKKFEIAI